MREPASGDSWDIWSYVMRGWNGAAHTLFSIFAFVALFAEPAHADRMALWKIVSLECVPHFEKGGAPVPCEHIDITSGEDRGYVDFKDQRGVAQMLTIPIRRVTGIEDPALLEPDTPNSFAGAWVARAYVEGHL